jgi:hypothetical protein
MCKGLWLGAALLTLAFARPAYAQRTVTFGSPSPRVLNNVPIDTSAAVAPFPQAQLTRPIPSGWGHWLPRWLLPFDTTLGASNGRFRNPATQPMGTTTGQ